MLRSWFFSHLAFLIGFLLALPVIAKMVRQRRSPAGSLAWLLIMALAPYVGIPLYLALGGRKMRRLAESKADLMLVEETAFLRQDLPATDRLLRSYGIPGASDGNQLKLCFSGEEGYAALVDLIEGARRTLWVSTFVLSPDRVGNDIINRLARRAAAGVEVLVLLDGVGSLHIGGHQLAPLTSAGGKVAYFMPVLHRPFRGRTNLRNHRKTVIADGCRVWAGGANLANEYIGPEPLAERWRDLSFLLEGPATLHYVSIFSSDWQFAADWQIGLSDEDALPRAAGVGDAFLQVVPSGPDVDGDPLYATMVSAVFQAQNRLWIVTPYFIPDETLAQALRLAVHRGVEVRILVPEQSNHGLADMARGPYLRDLQDAGAQILLYQPGMLHGKAMLVDDSVALVGSANFDMRSLFLNYETGLLIYSQKEILAVQGWMEDLARSCQAGVEKVGMPRDIYEGVVRLLAPLL